MADDLLTYGEAATILRVSLSTVIRWTRPGKDGTPARLTARQIGPKAVRLLRSDVDRLLTKTLPHRATCGNSLYEMSLHARNCSHDRERLNDDRCRRREAVDRGTRRPSIWPAWRPAAGAPWPSRLTIGGWRSWAMVMWRRSHGRACAFSMWRRSGAAAGQGARTGQRQRYDLRFTWRGTQRT